MQSLLALVVFLPLFHGLQSAQWSSASPQDGLVMYACAGGSVTLPWKYILSSGDIIGDIQWYYNGNSQEMVAISSHGNFFALPAFANRAKANDNAGITVSHLTVADSGNYTVEIHVYGDSGASHAVLRRSVLLQVSDHLMTQDGYLHVTQRSEPVLDTTTDQWAIQLQCGTFTFPGDPPFQLEWITSSGVIVNSSDFSDNHFNLLLTNPVQGGNYTCRVPPQYAAEACVHGNNGDHVQASIYVDRVDARLSLLEKENQRLRNSELLLQQKNDQLKEGLKLAGSNISQLQHQLQTLEQVKVADLQNRVSSNISQLQHVQTLEQVKVLELQGRVVGLENRTRQQIGFHATYLKSSTPPAGRPLIVDTVHYNYGGAYDGTTGYFTAPLSGLYFFAGTTGPDVRYDHDETLYLYVDNTHLCQVFTRVGDDYGVNTAHAVVHLTTGQRVWMGSDGSTYWYDDTTFSGFLVSPDP